MNEFPEGKCVWAQQTKLYVRSSLPKKSTQYCLNKKWESKNNLVIGVPHIRYAEKASQNYDIAKVVLPRTVKGTNELVTPRISIAFVKRIGSKKVRITFLSEVSSDELKQLLTFTVLLPVEMLLHPTCIFNTSLCQSAFNLGSVLLHWISV